MNTRMHDRNQRAYIRHPVNLTGRLAMAGQGNRQCRIADFCLGGVLVRFVDQGQAGGTRYPLEAGQAVALTLLVDGSRGQREITLPARVARTLEGGAGLQFDDPDPTDLLALQNHVRTHRESAQAPAAERESSRASPGPVLESVREELRAALTRCLENFFPGSGMRSRNRRIRK